jgi:hypothetical protein
VHDGLQYKMIELTREQAEMLFSETEVKHSRVEPMQSGFRIIIELSDSRFFFVDYNTKSHQKIYFLDGAAPHLPPQDTGHGINHS